MGVDYSKTAVALANISCSTASDIRQRISFHALDFLQPLDVQAAFSQGSFDLIVDKGTLDAITLNPSVSDYLGPEQDSVRRCHALIQLYKASLQYLLKKSSGTLMITSCNWTRKELLFYFSGMSCLLCSFAIYSHLF